MIVKQVGVLSLAKVLGTLYALLGLIVGAFMSLIAIVGGMGQNRGAEGVIFGIGAVIILPLMYGFGGLIGGLITGALYNVVAGIVGGIELELGPGSGDRYATPEEPRDRF